MASCDLPYVEVLTNKNYAPSREHFVDAKNIGERLTRAARLPGRAVCVFGSDVPRAGSVEAAKVDRCLARAVYKVASEQRTPSFHFSADSKAGICPGGQGWCGVSQMSATTRYFISTGRPDFRGGAAEHLKPDPEAADRLFAGPGKITFPSKYLNIAGWDQLEGAEVVLSFILIGKAESIRNLGGLIQYSFDDIFASIVMPSGPACASLITYAAGLSEKAPRNTAFVGPVDPTGNIWFPPDELSLAIPFEMARRIASDIEGSFLSKRPGVAFPVKRLAMNEKAEHSD